MARKRMIDPDLWADERVLTLPWPAVGFYIGLISNADDEGRMVWSASQLRAKIAPRDDVTVAKVDEFMEAVDLAGLVHTYVVDSKTYAFLPSWARHQKIKHPTASRIPTPLLPEPSGSPSDNASLGKVKLGQVKSVMRAEARAPEVPDKLPRRWPADVAALKSLATLFLGAFGNTHSPEAMERNLPPYVDVLAVMRSRGVGVSDAWKAFSECLEANGFKPLFGARAKSALSYLPSRSNGPASATRPQNSSDRIPVAD